MVIRFLAVLIAGLALIAPGAHLYELANKMQLARNEYFVVQSIYNGWWIAGLLLPLAFLFNLALAWVLSDDRIARYLALGAALCIAANLIIFWFYTQPANAATTNWTVIPENWVALRKQWEVSHAVNAGITLLAFGMTIAAAIRR